MDRSRCSAGIAALLLPFALGGCMMGHRHTFVYLPELGPDLGGGGTVVVFAVEDLRKDIVAGDEGPDWVGEQRNKYGVPFDVNTAGRRPFAEIVQETTAIDLEAIGFRTVLAAETATQSVPDLLVEHGAERGIAVVMRVFNSDTYLDIDVEWDLEARVFGPSGERLASHRIRGKRELQGSLLNPPRASKRKVPPFFNDLIHELVASDPAIVAALRGAGVGQGRTDRPGCPGVSDTCRTPPPPATAGQR